MTKITRRKALTRIGTAAGAALTLPRFSQAVGVADEYAKLNSAKYLSNLKVLAKVEHQKVFTEGPAVDRVGNVYFTNVPAEHIMPVWYSSNCAKKNTAAGSTEPIKIMIPTWFRSKHENKD